jgi:hypothetical protein
MLDRIKLLHELEKTSHQLFINLSSAITYAQQAWDEIKEDTTLCYKVRQATVVPQLPTWQGALGITRTVSPPQTPYTVISVDGSQIYPDRHQGTSSYLLNIGAVTIDYAQGPQGVTLVSKPYVCTPEYDEFQDASGVDIVTCKRTDYEFQEGLDVARAATGIEKVLLYDGSYIFWHLEGKEKELRDHFFYKHSAIFEQIYQERIPWACYTSMPRSKELINIVRFYLQEVAYSHGDDTQLNQIIDTLLLNAMLAPGEVTIPFEHHAASIARLYPPHLKPWFVYCNVGFEFVRIELPQWVVFDETYCNLVLSVCYDQALKGNGYPVVLAEAHEQAVVKGQDRDFFYHCVQKYAMQYRREIAVSQKSIKKRGIAF